MPDRIKIGRIILILVGTILVAIGIYFVRKSLTSEEPKVEVLGDVTISEEAKKEIVFEVAGSVEKPGVYKLSLGARVDDALILAGGISASADRVWLEKNLNRAAKLTDGQKIYIPNLNQQSQVISAKDSGTIKVDQGQKSVNVQNSVNINTSSLETLDTLPGIGPITAQKIIDQRPYSNITELLSKKVLTQKIYDGLKDKISVY